MARSVDPGMSSLAAVALATILTAASCAPAPTATNAPSSAAAIASNAPPGSSTPLQTRTLGAANAADSASQLASAIVGAADIGGAYTATSDVLARAGIRIETPTHAYVEAVAPITGDSMWPRQVLSAALEASNREHVDRISAADAGTILGAMGWAVPGAPGDPGESWLAVVRAWLADAKASPDDPTSFAPLFAAEMLRLGDGVDLATAPLATVHFGLLELLVLTAGFKRADAATATVELAAFWQPPENGAWLRAVEGPCDSTLERYGIPPGTGQVIGEPPAWMRKQAVGLLGLSGAAAKIAMKAMQSFAKIWRAAAFYFYSFVRVETIDKRLHKPNEDQSAVFTTFTAKAGVDPDAFKGWVKDNGGPNGVRELNDDTRCAEALGMPSLTDVGDVAEDSANWIVEWEALAGLPEHAEFAEPCNSAPTATCNAYDRHQPSLGMKLKNTGGSVSQADLNVKIKEEKKDDHPPGAMEREAPVTIRASVDSSTMPSISPANLTSPVGLIGPGLETIAGLVQSSFKPSAKATVIVTFHEPVQLVTDSAVDPIFWHGERCDASSREWLIDGTTSSGGYLETWTYFATIDPATNQGTYTYHASGSLPAGSITKDGSGRASAATRPDGSVILTVDAITVTGTIVAPGTVVTVNLPVPGTSFTWVPVADLKCP